MSKAGRQCSLCHVLATFNVGTLLVRVILNELHDVLHCTVQPSSHEPQGD